MNESLNSSKPNLKLVILKKCSKYYSHLVAIIVRFQGHSA